MLRGIEKHVVVDKIIGNVVIEGSILGKLFVQYLFPLTVRTPWGAQEVFEELEFEIPMTVLLFNRLRYSLHGHSEIGSS